MFLYIKGIYDEISSNLLILNQLSGNINVKVYNLTQTSVLIIHLT